MTPSNDFSDSVRFTRSDHSSMNDSITFSGWLPVAIILNAKQRASTWQLLSNCAFALFSSAIRRQWFACVVLDDIGSEMNSIGLNQYPQQLWAKNSNMISRIQIFNDSIISFKSFQKRGYSGNNPRPPVGIFLRDIVGEWLWVLRGKNLMWSCTQHILWSFQYQSLYSGAIVSNAPVIYVIKNATHNISESAWFPLCRDAPERSPLSVREITLGGYHQNYVCPGERNAMFRDFRFIPLFLRLAETNFEINISPISFLNSGVFIPNGFGNR